MAEPINSVDPIRIEIDFRGLSIVQMLTHEDDEVYFKLQNANIKFWEEFGNSIDDSVRAITERRTKKGNVRFGIYKDGELIGMEGYRANEEGSEAETGIMLDQQATGHGYATAAFKSMSEYAAARFERVFAQAAPDNASSIQLCQRSGYVLQHGILQTEWGPAVLLEYER
jgi:RimJ/RimL family protein N-acetyltransferase